MSRVSQKTQGFFLLLFVNIMWGLSFIFSKTALSEGIPVMTLAFFRYLFTALILVPVCLIREHGLRLKQWALRAFATTLLGITVYYFFEYAGLQRTTASAASLILALVPMMTLLERILFFKERVVPSRLLCVAISLLGVYLVIRSDGEGSGSVMGNLLMVCACLCWTGYILVMPKLMRACSSLRVTTWQAVAATCTLAPFALAKHSEFVMLSMRGWLCVLALAVICSALCYLLYGIAIRYVDPLTVSLSININPIAACIAGSVLLHESLTRLQLLGGMMILLCVIADTLITSKETK